MRDLPPPLPPDERTVGQVVGETMRVYGDNFWRALPIGVPLALVDQACVREPRDVQALVFWVAAPFIVAAFVWACSVVHHVRPNLTAFFVGLLIYLPFPALRAWYILPAVAWFALMGLAVPAALVEGLPFRAALVRGRRLGTADYVHALASLAVLVIVVGVGEQALIAALRSQGNSGGRAALLLADVVLSPLLYLGGAMLYFDQAARIGSTRPDRRRRRNAHRHPPVDSDPTGRADAQVEP